MNAHAINLGRYRLIDRAQLVHWRILLGVQGVTLLCCGLLTVWNTAQIWWQHKHQAALQAEKKVLDTRFAVMQAELPSDIQRDLLESKSRDLDRKIAHQKAYLAFAEDGFVGEKPGFSYLLFGFARHWSPQLWIQRVELENSGRFVHITGYATESTALPDLLERLAGEPSLSHLAFKQFKLHRDPDGGPYLQYSMESGFRQQPTALQSGGPA